MATYMKNLPTAYQSTLTSDTLGTDDFDYHLPKECIAMHPAEPRDSAKMLVFGVNNLIDDTVANLAEHLRAGDLLVFNDSKVIPARLSGVCGAAKSIEVTLHKNLGNGLWLAFAKPSRKVSAGDTISFSRAIEGAKNEDGEQDFSCLVSQKLQDGEVALQFNLPEAEFFQKLEKYGKIPLPPYIRKGKEWQSDRQNYQTIYAQNAGSVAAPTAGLHFTDSLFQKLEARGIHKAFVTLHVGSGTFLPVKTALIKDHKMHEEYYSISQETADKIEATRKSGGRIIAVGTTSLRTLEAASTNASTNWVLQRGYGVTNIFIYPGYQFKAVDGLLTNFHLPKSTLLMLVSAFVGTERIMKAYDHAIKNDYRFFSYGDCCLMLRN
jgi:S-adenosylmethionine:tRNA ribosyltransferase-isomerase